MKVKVKVEGEGEQWSVKNPLFDFDFRLHLTVFDFDFRLRLNNLKGENENEKTGVRAARLPRSAECDGLCRAGDGRMGGCGGRFRSGTSRRSDRAIRRSCL